MANEVHVTRCCVYHGCKYGDEGCPVASRELEQKYPCEQCAHAQEAYEEAWRIIADGRRWFGAEVPFYGSGA